MGYDKCDGENRWVLADGELTGYRYELRVLGCLLPLFSLVDSETVVATTQV
jgi:hypothetical protein